MTESTGPALDVALAYYHAWTGHDLDKAMSYIAEDIVCDAPAGRLEGATAYREFMGPFVRILIGSQHVAAFGDDEKAVVMYDTETAPVKSAPGAECVTVQDGKITHSLFVFNRAPFDAARQRAG
jgi:ketosteroid isomerase-like protein